MLNPLSGLPDAAAPTPDEAALARESCRQLSSLLEVATEGSLRVHLDGADAGDEGITIPAPAMRLLNDVLKQMAEGLAVVVLPMDAELTTQQAADILDVSRPFLIEQLEKGVIPHRKVGTCRRVALQDVLKYKEAMLQGRLKALDELVAQAQELGLGY